MRVHSRAEVSDSEEDDDEEEEEDLSNGGIQTYSEEQEKLKEDFKGAVGEMEEETGEREVLTLRKKTKEEKVSGRRTCTENVYQFVRSW